MLALHREIIGVVDNNTVGDFVKIDSLKLGEISVIDANIPSPSSVVPSNLANLSPSDVPAIDLDGDGRLDAYEAYPNDPDQ